MKIYDPPLMGAASASEPYFWSFKSRGAVPGFLLLPRAKSVIACFLPFRAARAAQNVYGQ